MHIDVHLLKITKCQKENPFVNTFSGYQNDFYSFVINLLSSVGNKVIQQVNLTRVFVL
jgi:hypothetical protein